MCLAVPMRIKKIEGDFAVAEAAHLSKRINIQMISSPKLGDYVMVHAGFAIERIEKKTAKKTLKIIDEIYI